MSKKILIVDDELIIAESLKTFLLTEGFEIKILVSDTKDFIVYLDNFKPDLIISDYLMPNNFGEILIEYVLNNLKNIPIIIITGYKESVRFQENEFLRIMNKPFFFNDLSDLIKVMIRR